MESRAKCLRRSNCRFVRRQSYARRPLDWLCAILSRLHKHKHTFRKRKEVKRRRRMKKKSVNYLKTASRPLHVFCVNSSHFSSFYFLFAFFPQFFRFYCLDGNRFHFDCPFFSVSLRFFDNRKSRCIDDNAMHRRFENRFPNEKKKYCPCVDCEVNLFPLHSLVVATHTKSSIRVNDF